MAMEVLFISHKYPPATGGMEKFSYELITGMASHCVVHTLVYDGNEPRWKWFYQLRKRTRQLLSDHPGISVIHLNDGLMISFCLWLKKETRVPVVGTLHGLDVVFPLPYFQKNIVPKFNHLDAIACVSHATLKAASTRGIEANKLIVITNGVDHRLTSTLADKEVLIDIYKKYGIKTGSRIITGMGRAVKRKGYSWFVTHVLPSLQEDVVFVMCGPVSDYGPRWWHRVLPVQWVERLALMLGHATDEPELKSLSLRYPGRFIRTGHMAFRDIEQLLKASQAFVMPNIQIEGDMEGFGLVALEAALAGTVVFAAGHEGITDAIQDNQNGYLLPPGNAEAWIQRLIHHLEEKNSGDVKQAFQQYTLDHFSWKKMVADYYGWFLKISQQG